MSHADIDPSLCTGERTLESLDDGFSPPAPDTTSSDTPAPATGTEAEPVLSSKSPF
jgi:hypothetical protein